MSLLDQLENLANEDWVKQAGALMPPAAEALCRTPVGRAALSKIVVLVHRQSNNRFIPRVWQLEAVLSLLRGSDTIVIAGTGSGKTLIFTLLHFALYPRKMVALVISPLKELMVMQV